MEDFIQIPSVETYVEVALIYHEKCTVIKKTNIDEGSAPKWNEVLSFDLNSENEKFSKEELAKSKTKIQISLFDKIRDTQTVEGQQIT